VPVPSGSAKDIKTNQGKGAEHASGNSQHKAGEGHVLPPNAAANAVNATASLGKVCSFLLKKKNETEMR
jgi:hypothetical protein